MNKKIVENISKALPAFFKNATDYLKQNFQEKGAKILENSTGSIGVLINLFAQPLVDKYFEDLSKKKLDNFGLDIYVKSSLLQAKESLELLEKEIKFSLTDESIFEIFNKSMIIELDQFDKNDLILIFQPQYHPAIIFIKSSYQRILGDLNINPNDIRFFLKHFNENIETTIVKQFGDDYETHIKAIEKLKLKENETDFLWDIIQQGRIGFKESENLKYETTYANWVEVSKLREKENDNLEEDKNIKIENQLKPIQILIEDYFNATPANHLEEILFIIADFGKGKSVFMRNYAAKLAKDYLQTGEGNFPIYFNLRNFKNYSSEPKLGVISDYLETKYSIKIDDDYFQKKKFVFLVDSLDESGELNKRAIDKVILSIKSIQSIDKTKYKTNRIIITTRPFDEGLISHLSDHRPFTKKNKEGRDIPYYINAYGFTKNQFNDWLFDTLKTVPNLEKTNKSEFVEKILKGINDNLKVDIYAELLTTNTLSRSELRRPIFAYMIYQLIINNVDFLAVGKLGVYLSFLNLLTKEAKHIHDASYKVNLKEEFEFRNILQTTASLWMFERQKGKQGSLKKSDICRTIEGKSIGENDNEILERFKGQGLTEIQFLSHSYFGENDNILHFQHQSFAEILLAEYYLKVFIKYALDPDSDLEEARIKLTLGEPTEQTIVFFKEMLRLLKETATLQNNPIIKEKRILLFPLMASLATQKNNKLFCNDIFYSWYKNCSIGENQAQYPKNSVESWCIDETKIVKVVDLAKKILNSSNDYLLTTAHSETALFDNEVLVIQKTSIGNLNSNIDKWLALLVGNSLHNDFTKIDAPKLFNTDYNINPHHLFDLIKNWNYTSNTSSPSWGKELFKGINMQDNVTDLDLSHYNLDSLDFSYGYFKNVHCWNGNWCRTRLHYCSFVNLRLITSLFYSSSIKHIKMISNTFSMHNCTVGSSGFFLFDAFKSYGMGSSVTVDEFKWKSSSLITFSDLNYEDAAFDTCEGFLVYGLQQSFFTIKTIKTWFQFDSEQTKQIFFAKIDALKEFETKKPRAKKNKTPKLKSTISDTR